MTKPPADSEYASFYAGYVAKIAGVDDVVATLEQQRDELAALPAAVDFRETYRYAPGKWSVREVVGHLGDAERIFGYRLYCFSRGERQSLPGFDENEYAARSGAAERPLAELVAELLALARGQPRRRAPPHRRSVGPPGHRQQQPDHHPGARLRAGRPLPAPLGHPARALRRRRGIGRAQPRR